MTASNLKHKLALATTSLLASGAQAAQPSENQPETTRLYNKWTVDVGYLHYNEPDYISVDTYMAMINGNLSDKDTIKLGLVFDTLTGATPTGALPGSESVTVSGTSGGGVSADGSKGGTAPFNDTRLAMDVTWGHEWERLKRSKFGVHVSVEGDYTSVGGSLTMELDSKDRTYTYTAGIGASSDKVGRSNEQTPSPLTQSSKALMFGAGHKNSFDVMLGVTRVINRRTVGMANFSISQSLGYHTDPYKVISVADKDDIEITDGATFEHRPDARTRYILYTKVKHELPENGHHLGLSYRFHTDSWDINSHTVEGSYSFPVLEHHKLEPFVRLYHQQAANFYTKTLAFDGLPTSTWETAALDFPKYASADIRLAEMFSTTIGAKFRYMTSTTGSVDIRMAYYYRDYRDAVVDNDSALFAVVDFGKSFN